MYRKFTNKGAGLFEITGRPGTYNLLWILGKSYILSKKLVFLRLYEKYVSSFSLINL